MISPDPPGPDGGGRYPSLVPALAAACGALAMTAALGPGTVHPENIDWLMRGDFSLHFLGWHLYWSGPWTMPIGATPLLIWPVGSSVGLTDSIPLASVFFKLLDPILPSVFQFIGMWLVLCVALQGAFGALESLGLCTFDVHADKGRSKPRKRMVDRDALHVGVPRWQNPGPKARVGGGESF